MFECFERYMTSLVDVSVQELEYMQSLSVIRKLQRRELLLKEGEICRNKYFVARGLLRNYRLKEDGTEYVMRFAAENIWTTDSESLHSQQPSKYNIEALEPTTVIAWTIDAFLEMVDKIPTVKALADKITIASLAEGQNRILAGISYTPEEKYQSFITSYPDIFQRVPLHMVASYLGISRETLSRVRQARVRQ